MLKSHKTSLPSKPANFFGPCAGRFREVSLYIWTVKHLCHYKTIVRINTPGLCKCSLGPLKTKPVLNVEQIESVQRRATKQRPGMKDLSYSERLRKLKLQTLSNRRARENMI